MLILCSVPSNQVGLDLARMLVDQSLVACVQILPKITSIYRWENKLCEESEELLLMKSKDSNFKNVEKLILDNHPYSTPEIVAIDIDLINQNYLDWLKISTN